MTRRMFAVMVVVAGALSVGCGGRGSEVRRAAVAHAPHATVDIVGRTGRLVAIGGGRSLFLACAGSGSPTVVLDAGLGGSADDWQDVQSRLGETTRTCAYDRAGIGPSSAIPGVHDARAEIDDLERLLGRAGIAPPWVLVGHSYGGLLARLFAHAHPAQTAGVVLVDAMGRDQTRRILAIWPRSQAKTLRREQATPVREGVDVAASEALAARVHSLGDTPLAVVTGGYQRWPHMGPSLTRAQNRQWATMQNELATLSSDHLHVVALRSGHFVQRADGQPEVVVRAVQAVVRAARDHTRLPPCQRLFSGSDVRCRN
jgi:pimeloyl-ACP methyl ester carboxylesterase